MLLTLHRLARRQLQAQRGSQRQVPLLRAGDGSGGGGTLHLLPALLPALLLASSLLLQVARHSGQQLAASLGRRLVALEALHHGLSWAGAGGAAGHRRARALSHALGKGFDVGGEGGVVLQAGR